MGLTQIQIPVRHKTDLHADSGSALQTAQTLGHVITSMRERTCRDVSPGAQMSIHDSEKVVKTEEWRHTTSSMFNAKFNAYRDTLNIPQIDPI